MSGVAGSGGGVVRAALRVRWPGLFAAAAVSGGAAGIAATFLLILAGIGPLTGTGWVALVAYVLTTLSLGGVYALVDGARSRLCTAAVLVVLASLLGAVCFFAYWRTASFAPGEGSRLLAVGFWAAYSARPLAILLFGGVAVASGGGR
jgi:hypothetical protein